MKKLFDYYHQVRRYGDSEGLCLVELEEGDNKEEIIKEFTKDREWYEQKYHFKEALNRYEYEMFNGIRVYEGNLLLFQTRRANLD